MFSELQQPGYLHVLINHLPIIGTLMGLIAVLIGLLIRERKALIPGLILLLIAGLSAWPVYETGEAAYKAVRKIADDPGRDSLDEHMDRADKTVWVFYAMAGVSAAALLVPLRWPKSGVTLAVLSLVAAAASTAVSIYIAQPGGLIRHSEFRVDANNQNSPPEKP